MPGVALLKAEGAPTVESVVQFDEELRRARQLAAEALERRDTAILELLDGGTRQATLAVRLGVSAGRVSQIASAARRRQRPPDRYHLRSDIPAARTFG